MPLSLNLYTMHLKLHKVETLLYKLQIKIQTVILIFKLFIIADIDECSEGSHTCDENANCTNTNGSFKCDCKVGFSGNGKTCEGTYICTMFSKTLLYQGKTYFTGQFT